MSPSFAIRRIDVPAERPIWPPRPGCNSTLWTTVPVGIFASDMQFPTAISASSPDITVMPTVRRFGREDVALLAVGVVEQGDVGRAVGVVLDRGDAGRDTVLASLEVDLAVQALGSAAAVA